MLFLTNIDLNGNQVQNFIVQPVGSLPGTGKEGQLIYNSSDKLLYQYDGSSWQPVGKSYILPMASEEVLGGIKIGAGLQILEDGKVNVVAEEIEAGSVNWANVNDKPAGLVIDESYVHTDNNYTTEDKSKLSGIANGAEVNVQADWNEVSSDSDAFIKNKPTIPATAEDIGAIPTTEKGFANGVAELDENGLVPSNQLPSYVDDVLEFANKSSFPQTGESGKIYVAQDTNLTYRWSGSQYVEISASLALGETSSTAFPGDKGKVAYDHSQLTSGNPHNVSLTDLGVTATAEEINGFKSNIETINAELDKKANNDDLSAVAKSGSYNDLSDKPKLTKVQEDILTTSETTKTVTITGGKIFSVMIYDSVTFEEVMTDKTFNSDRSQVKIDVAQTPTNNLNIVVSYLEV